MSPSDYSKARLVAVLEEIRRLKESEFAYPHSRDALGCIEDRYNAHLSKLQGLPEGKDPRIVNGYCGEALLDLFSYLPLLGFILRSTNVRNAFEVYGPILRLAQQVLDPTTKLILSSEWDFSPYTYKDLAPLPNFVLIGLPASEAENALLLPLAGHELGHTFWQFKNLESAYYTEVEQEVMRALEAAIPRYVQLYPNHNVKPSDKSQQLGQNIFVKRTIAPAVNWALHRAEEYFCDCVGLFLFDEAFLHSYAYLLSPKIACARSLDYPNNKARIANLIRAAAEFQKSAPGLYQVPLHFDLMFEDAEEQSDPECKFLSSLADTAAQGMCGRLITATQELLKAASVPQLSIPTKKSVLNEFRMIVPASNAGSLTNVLNAAWYVLNDSDFWPGVTDERKRQKILQELVLKNIEILEIEERTK